jgi:methylenetetrahydrofolate reductase (NADPH)
MKLSEQFKVDRPMLSFEVFPPKTEARFEPIMSAVEEIAKLDPAYMSVTYGAGGDGSQYTVDIAKRIKAMNVTPLAHLTCVSSDKAKIHAQLSALKAAGIENILALRGDLPKDYVPGEYRHASELIDEIHRFDGDFCIGGACYPEGHPESARQKDDIQHLKEKVDCGCEFLTTQMFFDNDLFYNFMYKIREAGINVPIIAGIMPVTNAAQISRIVDLSGAFMPQSFLNIVDHFRDDPASIYEAGIAYATEQIVDLFANGINHVHVYSMNKPDVAADIQNNLKSILDK